MASKPNMKVARREIEAVISELKPGLEASSPVELVMYFSMAIMRLNNALEAAGLTPIDMILPCPKESETQPGLFDQEGTISIRNVNARREGSLQHSDIRSIDQYNDMVRQANEGTALINENRILREEIAKFQEAATA